MIRMHTATIMTIMKAAVSTMGITSATVIDETKTAQRSFS